jgi:GMP synthase (glutamine-hydrolysing)
MANRALQAIVFTHLPFEDLGTLEPRLTERGFQIESVDVTTARFPVPHAADCDLLVIMGGPVGVYDAPAYPFITAELDCLRQRLSARKPTLGICLGAQLMAAALGARVCPGSRGPEIGWSPIQSPAGADAPQWFKPLLDSDLYMLHWHGDTFDIPAGVIQLAETQLYSSQAFTLENFALGLQFHPEVTAEGLERWYVGHACELSMKKISVSELRAAAHRHAPALARAAHQFWNGWLDSLFA